MTNECLNADDLAALLGVSDSTVRDLTRRGIVVRTGRGRYDVQASVKAYCSHLRETAAGRGGEKGVLDLTAERARLAKEQADGQSLKNATARGNLVEVEAVERQWVDILSAIRSRMLACTTRIRQRLPHLTAFDADAIDREIRDGLTELANAELVDGETNG